MMIPYTASNQSSNVYAFTVAAQQPIGTRVGESNNTLTIACGSHVRKRVSGLIVLTTLNLLIDHLLHLKGRELRHLPIFAHKSERI